ncbi:helix-turn-helix domain-containing protein [Actinocorallia aurea]
MDTAGVPDTEKLAFWSSAVGRALAPMAVTPHRDRPFAGTITAGQYGYLKVATMTADPSRARRTARLIDRSPHDEVVVGVQREGTAELAQNGRSAALAPGDLVLFHTARPYLYDHAERAGLSVFRLPRPLLRVREADVAQVTATAIGPGEPVADLVAPFLTALAGEARATPAKVGERMAGHVADLVTTLIEARVAPADDTAALTRRIRDYVNLHLADRGLTPERVAAAHHISVRHLYKLFESEGLTIGRWIQQRRLEECGRELARRGRSAPGIAAVAHRWGFVNAAHFSRTFRGAYGMSPSAWRDAHDNTDRHVHAMPQDRPQW